MKKEWSIKIQQARKAMGLTQKELGEAIGVAERTIIKFENSTGFPSYYTLIQLCNYLNLNPYEIIELCDHPEYYEKEYNAIARIINSSDELEVFSGTIGGDSNSYDSVRCTIIFSENGVPYTDVALGKEMLLEKSYEIKQRLKKEYERQLLKYVKSLVTKQQKKKSK